MTVFSFKEREHIQSIVLRCMFFRFTAEETIAEIKKEYQDKNISYPTLARLKRQIKDKYIKFFNSLRKDQDSFLYLIIEKYKNIDTLIREYHKLLEGDKTDPASKIKILNKLSELEINQLLMLRDLPFYDYVHKDTWKELDKQYKKLETMENSNYRNDADKDLSYNKNETHLEDESIKQTLNSRTDTGLDVKR